MKILLARSPMLKSGRLIYQTAIEGMCSLYMGKLFYNDDYLPCFG